MAAEFNMTAGEAANDRRNMLNVGVRQDDGIFWVHGGSDDG